MNNVLKNSLYTTAWIVLVSLNSVNAAINPGTGVQNTLRTEWTAIQLYKFGYQIY